jgi:hypothetical protein
MPWTCPACRLTIRHSDTESNPRPGVTYRCHVCRLELVVDTERSKMTVPPSAIEHTDAPNESRPSHCQRSKTPTRLNTSGVRAASAALGSPHHAPNHNKIDSKPERMFAAKRS